MSRYVFSNDEAQDCKVLSAARKAARSHGATVVEVARRHDAAGGRAGAGALGGRGAAGLAVLPGPQRDPDSGADAAAARATARPAVGGRQALIDTRPRGAPSAPDRTDSG
ncbi:MAG: hypothetical protein MZW92_65840 [Comamonadaceae bacterium]|nr:hypothetical protein [Comamonadaceae bacterium]